jgi:hypothetical protein
LYESALLPAEDKLPRENDLEGVQDMGGKHGGQKGIPKPPPRPHATERDEDVPAKGEKPHRTKNSK